MHPVSLDAIIFENRERMRCIEARAALRAALGPTPRVERHRLFQRRVTPLTATFEVHHASPASSEAAVRLEAA
ncbi:MAG: hypothetical protein ACKVT1_00955 [Dehalococcoidia bacterium]